MSTSAEALSELGMRVSSVVKSDLVEELAVVATFDPERDVPNEQLEAVAHISDTLADRDGRQEWMLKEGTRVEALARVLRRGGLHAVGVVRRRVGEPNDTALQRLLDAMLRNEPIDLEQLDEDELLASLHVSRWCAAAGSRAGLPQLTQELDRDRIEGRLALLETLRPLWEITRDGCVGREAELGRLHEYVDGPSHQRLTDRPPLLVYGVGGVGKSTLIARFLLDLAERSDPVAWAYLDLDRPSLSSYDPLALLTDVIRQVGAQFPLIRRFLDYSGSEAAEQALGSGLEGTNYASLREVAVRVANAANNVAGGRLIIVLDTYEELQRAELIDDKRGTSVSLYRMFDILSDYADGFRLVVSGRAPALTFVSSQSRGTDQRLHVGAFRGTAATTVLKHLYDRELERLAGESPPAPDRFLAPALVDEVVTTVGGSPLALRLAARVLAMEGKAGLEDAAARANAIGRVTDEFVKGFLYHRILGHIKGVHREDREGLQKVAMAALALRQVTTDLLREVVFPALGRSDLDAGSMLSGLMAETALADSQDGTVRLRDELRGPALLALRYDQPGLVDDVHVRAAAYYAVHPELPGATVELAYHQLATGNSDVLHGLEAAAIVALERSAADLPPATRELVISAANDPQGLSKELQREAGERETEAATRRALDAGDLDTAARVIGSDEERLPTTRLHRLEAELAEARGDLQAAVAAARRDVSAALAAEDPQRYGAAVVLLALLSERMREPMEAVAALSEADGQPWLAGHAPLRLELQLNRLVILERSAAGAVDRWVLELDARALLQKVNPAAVRSNTALVRLLAATLGRDEASWVLEAVGSVGLGTLTSTNSSQIENLARELAGWDMGHAEPGSVAQSVGLESPWPPTAESLTSAWFVALAGQALDAVPLLDRAFSLARPSAEVIEALRLIYLWWGLNPQHDLAEAMAEEPSPHFLDGPLDLGDSAAQRLVRALAGAYPSPTDRQVLASQIGLDVESLNVKSTSGMSTRNLLDQAASLEKLPLLLGQVLSDPKTAAFHGELRDLVGPEWLERHGIAR
jgi:KaiC/GvpD/RAD55 family RecA-like ATPase